VSWQAEGATASGAKAPFPGRFIATDSTLSTVTLNPTLALLVTEQLGLGVGLDVHAASAELRRQVQLGETEGSAHLGGTARAVGFNVGALAVLVPGRLNAGFAYRSGVALDFDLKAHFAVPPELQGAVKVQPARLQIPLPH